MGSTISKRSQPGVSRPPWFNAPGIFGIRGHGPCGWPPSAGPGQRRGSRTAPGRRRLRAILPCSAQSGGQPVMWGQLKVGLSISPPPATIEGVIPRTIVPRLRAMARGRRSIATTGRAAASSSGARRSGSDPDGFRRGPPSLLAPGLRVVQPPWLARLLVRRGPSQ